MIVGGRQATHETQEHKDTDMTKQLTTRQAKNRGANVETEITEIIQMWTDKECGYGYETAELKRSAMLRRGGGVIDDPNHWTLWLDGELSEIEYGWFEFETGVMLFETHNA